MKLSELLIENDDSTILTDPEEIYQWLIKYNDSFIKPTRNQLQIVDGMVDFNGDIFLGKRNLKTIPIRFRKVNGVFECYDNELTSFDNIPKICHNLSMCGNKITSFHNFHKRLSFDKQGDGVLVVDMCKDMLSLVMIKNVKEIRIFENDFTNRDLSNLFTEHIDGQNVFDLQEKLFELGYDEAARI